MKTNSPMLERLILRGFRSFRAEAVTFENPLFLVGQNGSGKSNLTDAFAFLAEAMRSPLEAVVESRGGFSVVAHKRFGRGRPANLGMAVELKNLRPGTSRVRYGFELRAKGAGGDFEVVRERCAIEEDGGSLSQFDRTKASRGSERWESNVEGLVPVAAPNHLALPLVGGHERFRAVHAFLSEMQVCRIEPAALRSLQDPESGVRLRADGRNSASVLREIQRRTASNGDAMQELLETAVPGTVGFRAKRLGPKLTIEFTQSRGEASPVRFHAANMSDGTLRLLGLLLAVFQHPAPTLLAIEEPEITMHPGAVGAILDVLRWAVGSMQVVVTTHSPDVLDAKWIEDRHLRVVHAEDGLTRVTGVSAATRQALAEHLMGAGELLRANALRASTEPLVAPPSLFADDNE